MPPEEERQRLVLNAAHGRVLSITELPSTGSFVVDNLSEGRRLGEIQGDAMPFLIEMDGMLQIVVAGVIGGDGKAQFVALYLDRQELVCRVLPDPSGLGWAVWMSFPAPFKPGMKVTVICQDGGRNELWRAESPPLMPDTLSPLFAPDWVRYAPLTE